MPSASGVESSGSYTVFCAQEDTHRMLVQAGDSQIGSAVIVEVGRDKRKQGMRRHSET